VLIKNIDKVWNDKNSTVRQQNYVAHKKAASGGRRM